MNRKEVSNPIEAADTFVFANSSNVVSGDYGENSRVMHIEFKSGRYAYHGIPKEVWEGLKAAPSAGAYINSVIVGPDRKNPIYKGVRIGD